MKNVSLSIVKTFKLHTILLDIGQLHTFNMLTQPNGRGQGQGPEVLHGGKGQKHEGEAINVVFNHEMS